MIVGTVGVDSVEGIESGGDEREFGMKLEEGEAVGGMDVGKVSEVLMLSVTAGVQRADECEECGEEAVRTGEVGLDEVLRIEMAEELLELPVELEDGEVEDEEEVL